MNRLDKKGILIFLVLIVLVFGIFTAFTRWCFVLDSKLPAVEDTSSWLTSKRLLNAYLSVLLPPNADVAYTRPTDEPRASFPHRVYFPITQAEVPDNPRAFRETPNRPYVWHPPMIPTPYVMYAPAPGRTGGNIAQSFHNRQQFRYPEDLSVKAPNEFRIFVTGGSTAWGFMAPDLHTTISAFLELALRRDLPGTWTFKVINAGVNGFSTTHERIWIQNRVLEYEPDLILAYSGYNDVYARVVEKTDLHNRLNNDSKYFYAAVREYEYYNRGEETVRHLQDLGKLFYDPGRFPRQTVENLEMIAAYLSRRDIPFVFVLQPIHKHSRYNDALLPEYPKLAADMRDAARTAPFTFVDHSGLFDDREHLFADECHFGDLGNEIIAETILRDIRPILEEVVKKRRAMLPAGRP